MAAASRLKLIYFIKSTIRKDETLTWSRGYIAPVEFRRPPGSCASAATGEAITVNRPAVANDHAATEGRGWCRTKLFLRLAQSNVITAT